MASTMLTRAPRCFGTRTTHFVRVPPVRAVRVVMRGQSSQKEQVSHVSKPIIATVLANIVMAMPAAADIGKLFEFNITLPIMAGEFLLLMVFLDKFWFTPLGKVLDERDALIRERLSSVKGDTSGVDALLNEAEAVLRAARTEVSSMINTKKNEKVAELDKEYAAAKAKVNAEVESAIAAMEKESEATLKKLDGSVEKIATELLKRVLPEGVKV